MLGLWGANTEFKLSSACRTSEGAGRATRCGETRTRAPARRAARRRSTETLATSLGLTRVTRLVDGFELGYANLSEGGEARKNGYELSFEIPLFDWGSSRVARAEAQYMQAAQRAVRRRWTPARRCESYSAYRTAYDLAQHYRDEVVPLAKRISEENVYRYNGMLIGTFELLADAREQVRSVTGAVEALRDFWMADTDLQTALNAGGAERRGPDARIRRACPRRRAAH
ncbi:MAG: TolC family protein [Betaproteobacteria bacterium]|nr:TolC family protein [Betaproteobacteria bacterium]